MQVKVFTPLTCMAGSWFVGPEILERRKCMSACVLEIAASSNAAADSVLSILTIISRREEALSFSSLNHPTNFGLIRRVDHPSDQPNEQVNEPAHVDSLPHLLRL